MHKDPKRNLLIKYFSAFAMHIQYILKLQIRIFEWVRVHTFLTSEIRESKVKLRQYFTFHHFRTVLMQFIARVAHHTLFNHAQKVGKRFSTLRDKLSSLEK